MPGEFTIHPAADLFPMMEGADFDALLNDIREHGQRDPITVYQGSILDGRNRYRALLQLDREPMTIEWDGKGTPEEFVASMNLHRRHLSESQRAMIAARLVTFKQGENLRASVTQISASVSIPQAAEMLNVSRGSVNNARRVLAHATDEEIAAIDRGERAAGTVAKQIKAKMTPEQREKEHVRITAQPYANRNETTRANTLLWQNLKGAMLAINNLPQPADMVSIVQAWDRSKITDKQLLRTVNWLQGFAAAWAASKRDAA